MKRIQLYLIALAGVLVTGCYDDYMVDYDYDAIYTAYQYDLRTFVLGEKQGFDFTVGLGGLDHNDRDRKVSVSLQSIEAHRMPLDEYMEPVFRFIETASKQSNPSRLSMPSWVIQGSAMFPRGM